MARLNEEKLIVHIGPGTDIPGDQLPLREGERHILIDLDSKTSKSLRLLRAQHSKKPAMLQKLDRVKVHEQADGRETGLQRTEFMCTTS